MTYKHYAQLLLECSREGTSESTSLDGLAATTFVAAENDNDEDMDYDDGGVNSVKFEGNCRKCGKYGHKAADCRQKLGLGRSDQKDRKKCYRCDRQGHLKRDCIAKTKANGEKIIEKPGDKKGFTNKKDKSGKIRKGTGIRTQNEVTDDESEDENKSFLDEKGDSEEEE